MILNKYSEPKENQPSVIGASSSSSSSSNPGASSAPAIDRTIWGQKDIGDDIDGSMAVNGNVYIGEIEYDENDEESGGQDPSAEDLFDFPSDSGNLRAQNQISSKTIVAEDFRISAPGNVQGDSLIGIIQELSARVSLLEERLSELGA